MRDIVMYGALVGQAICAVGGMVVVVLMFRRRAKERRKGSSATRDSRLFRLQRPGRVDPTGMARRQVSRDERDAE
jgi:hypothetical protein